MEGFQYLGRHPLSPSWRPLSSSASTISSSTFRTPEIALKFSMVLCTFSTIIASLVILYRPTGLGSGSRCLRVTGGPVGGGVPCLPKDSPPADCLEERPGPQGPEGSQHAFGASVTFASTGVRPPAWAEESCWNCRELLTEKWNLELKIHGIASREDFGSLPPGGRHTAEHSRQSSATTSGGRISSRT